MGKILKHIGRVFFFLLVLCILGGAGVGFYTYKKTFYDGHFIQGKFSYTKEWKLSYLIKYKENYQKNKSVGFAVVNIPKEKLIALCQDIDSHIEFFDSREGHDIYNFLSQYADNSFVSMFFHFCSGPVGYEILQGVEAAAGNISGLVRKGNDSVDSIPVVSWLVSRTGIKDDVKTMGKFFSNIQEKISDFRHTIDFIQDFIRSTESFDVGNEGKYFIIHFSDWEKHED